MEVEAYVPGTPSWVDVASDDLPASVAFYSELFGWTAHDQGPETGHYTMFEYNGQPVGAAGPKTNPGPPTWATYVTVEDADATVALIEENGGSVLMGAMDVMEAGRMAVASDPSGGHFSIWQPMAHIGAKLVNEPNTLVWNELTVRDPDSVLEFYSSVFGWTVNLIPGNYRELQLEGKGVAGCIQMDDKWPAEIPTHWMAYFAVEDCDSMAKRVGALGGSVSVEPFDLPVGRVAVVNDPCGAVFSMIQMNEQP